MVKSMIGYACLILLVCAHCKKEDKNLNSEHIEPGPDKEEIRRQVAEYQKGLVPDAERVLENILDLERNQDVTCWTSFRQLDWFIAEMQYDETATLAKTLVMKSWILRLWEKASQNAQGDSIKVENLQDAVFIPSLNPDFVAQDVSTFANGIGLKNFKDYQKTAEHWRLILSAMEEAIAYPAPERHLKNFDQEALIFLADQSTTLSLHLLKSSTAKARASGHRVIRKSDLHQAFNELSKNFNLQPSDWQSNEPPDQTTRELLLPLVEKLIVNKAKALTSFNKSETSLADNLNKVSETPLSQEAVQSLYADLKSFVFFTTAGFQPMRSDNYLSDGSFENKKMNPRSYMSDIDVQNTVQQIFPHHILANGDIQIKLEPNPGQPHPISKKKKTIELKLLDHELNGVRDSAVHWQALADVFNDKPFVVDPFGLEYLSEVSSMMMTLWLKRGAQIAKEMGLQEINQKVAQRVRSKDFVMVPPILSKPESWDKSKVSQKTRLLNKYPNRFYEDVTWRSGLPRRIAKKPRSDQQGNFDLQKIMGGGIAVGDINNDGLPDVYVAGYGKGRLYLNKSRNERIKFVDATTSWKLSENIFDGHGVLFFDVDGDDDLDLFITRSENPSLLFENNGNSFRDITSESQIKTTLGAHVTTAFDADNDGDLDLFVGTYGSAKSHESRGQKRSLPSMDGRNGSPNQLWQNNNGVFKEIGEDIGLNDVGWTLAASAFDKDIDGDLDLYIANDFGPNQFFENNGDGTFKNITNQNQTGDRGSGMNVDVTDVNNDGLWDIYVSNIDMFSKNIKVIFPKDNSTININQTLAKSFQYLSGNKFYVSNPDRSYKKEERHRFEPVDRGWAWDSSFFDYDNDGDDDLYVTNGWIKGSPANNQRNQLYLNDNGTYFLASTYSPEAFAGNSRSSVVVDFDRDGDMDLLVNQFKAPAKMLQNNRPKRNKWLGIRIKSETPNTFGIGSRVVVHSGGKKQMKRVTTGKGYLGQSDSVLIFGLNKENFANVEIIWPGNVSQNVGQLIAGQIHEISQINK